MKKYLVLLLIAVLICGCENVEELTIEQTLDIIAVEEEKTNIYRVGYQYYLPRGMQIDENSLYNEVISNSDYNFYLFVDMVNYLNEKENLYKENNASFYSKIFNYEDNYGYIEINKIENNKFLIEIMYNYAKIEVVVIEKDINQSIIYALNVLKSIKYNDSIIKNLLEDDILKFASEEYNLFNTESSDNNYLDYEQNYIDPGDSGLEYDPDLIN